MKTKTVFAVAWICAVLMAPLTGVLAQHGDAGPDFQAPGFLGDTWTGQVSVIDPEKREITLTATTKKGAETFVAYVPAHFTNGDEKAEVKMSDFAIGQNLRVFYIPKNPKINGQKVRRNEIIRIESVPASKRS
jgi:hypothetical protein